MQRNRTHLPMETSDGHARTKVYLLLLAIQMIGAIAFVWKELPEFAQVLLSPGDQLPHDALSDLTTVGVFAIMQVAFWYRVLYVPIPPRNPNVVFNHLFLFLGRLSFVFGGALFSVVVFRHLPELGRDTDVLLSARRGIILLGSLFALFCASLEVERLGQAFDSSRH